MTAFTDGVCPVCGAYAHASGDINVPLHCKKCGWTAAPVSSELLKAIEELFAEDDDDSCN